MTRFRTLEASNPALTPDGFDFVTVKSPALGRRADLTLFAPRQAQGQRGLPLVLLLHGVYGSHWAWAFQGGAHRTLQALVDRGAVPPMVLAMPSDGLWGDGSGYVPHADADFERWIVDEVPAAARQQRPELDDTSPLALIGLSMGGFAALRLAARYPQRWCAALVRGGRAFVYHRDGPARCLDRGTKIGLVFGVRNRLGTGRSGRCAGCRCGAAAALSGLRAGRSAAACQPRAACGVARPWRRP